MKIIISVPKPAKHSKAERELRSIASEINNLLKSGVAASMISEGSWQIDGESGLPVLASLMHALEAENVSYRILFVESGTEWKHSF
jgi:hypothetical protein